MEENKNPFDLVKATDLSDGQIAGYFVDFPAGASLIERIKPRSPMPMLIYGGKGSGKTHLMRYLSYALQRRRLEGLGREGISGEGYLGLYFRCGGLNSQRFTGKGQSLEIWSALFAYYMELWLGQVVLGTMRELLEEELDGLPETTLQAAVSLFDIAPDPPPLTFRQLESHLERRQRAVDVAVNNCALTGQINILVDVSPGRLVFELPRILRDSVAGFGNVLFLYLVDEFENLTQWQQCYMNTLIRERQEPATLKIGVRLYGVRTYQTLSAGEENREDSEFEALRLDSELRERPSTAQLEFAKDLVRKRLKDAGYMAAGLEERNLGEWFETEEGLPGRAPIGGGDGGVPASTGRSFEELHRKLVHGLGSGAAPGIAADAQIGDVLTTLQHADDPLLERTSIFLFYRAWSRGEDLPNAARRISASARTYSGSGALQNEHREVLRHFRADIMAQLLREARQKQRYLGFETFVKMSAGLPRGLLTILKHVFTWSLFYGEHPFSKGRISVRAQTDGVAQASEWFFTEARAPGASGLKVRDGMTRLGQLLRGLRFSDKPSECSLSTFSADMTSASPEAVAVLREAENWSMLIRITGGQHDRNEGRVDDKFQVHPMLAPRWDLPISRRGALGLSGDEVTAIFAPQATKDFDNVYRRRVSLMTAPFFGPSPHTAIGGGPETIPIPGFLDE